MQIAPNAEWPKDTLVWVWDKLPGMPREPWIQLRHLQLLNSFGMKRDSTASPTENAIIM